MSAEERALSKLFPRLTAYAMSRCNDKALAKELVSQTLCSAAEQLSKGMEIRDIMAWCVTVLRNKHLDHIKKKKEDQLDSDNPEDHKLQSASIDQDPFSQLLYNECMKLLSENYREVLFQNLVEGETTASIAERISKPQNTVLTWLTKAKLQFHNCVVGKA